MPNALAIGVPYEVFWHINPTKLESFRKAHQLKRQMQDEEAWLNGIYSMRAFEVVMAHFGAGLSGKKSSAKYFDEPMLKNAQINCELTEEEKQREVDKFFARENARRINWKRNKARNSSQGR